MIARRPRPLCAICAERTADTITDWECESGRTRTIVACWPCLSPVPDPSEEYEPVDLAERAADAMSPERIAERRRTHARDSREVVTAVLRNLGSPTIAEICDALHVVDAKARDVVQQHVQRLMRAGAVVASGAIPRRYTLTVDPIAEARSRLSGASGPFLPRDLGLSKSQVTDLRRAGVIRQLRRVAGATRLWEVAS